MAAILKDGVLRLSGYVGDYYYEDHFTSADVVLALAQVEADSELTVHLNSAGGVASEGAAIHAVLVGRAGVTDIVVEGVAMSAASLIAMAGATVTMSAGAVMMIHDPASITWGTSAEHAKTMEQLEALATAYARVYADKAGKTVDECREIMKAETWFTPQQAVDAGFADETTEKKAVPVAAFDYRVFDHAPKRLVALAAKKDWRLPDVNSQATAAGQTRQPRESHMTDKNNGGDDAAELKRLREENATMLAEKGDRSRREAIMALPEAAKRTKQATALCDAGLTAEAAKGVLAVSAEDAAPVASGDGPLPDPVDYAARRAAGAGLGGGAPTAQAPSLVATMRKLLNKEAI